MSQQLDEKALGQLFTEARTHNGWLDQSIPEDTLRALYDLVKMGPTSANCSPARFVFVRSAAGKEKLNNACTLNIIIKSCHFRLIFL